jgi:hypothetical protein
MLCGICQDDDADYFCGTCLKRTRKYKRQKIYNIVCMCHSCKKIKLLVRLRRPLVNNCLKSVIICYQCYHKNVEDVSE